MENKNPLIRLIIYGKIKRMMTSYKNVEWKSKDMNLIKGVFRKKLKDFDEDYRDRVENKSLFARLRG
jgi:hypothetical protein